jgi:hypothetical protein
MHDLSFVICDSQWNSVFLLRVELPCLLWNEASFLLRETSGRERAGGAGISLCMD